MDDHENTNDAGTTPSTPAGDAPGAAPGARPGSGSRRATRKATAKRAPARKTSRPAPPTAPIPVFQEAPSSPAATAAPAKKAAPVKKVAKAAPPAKPVPPVQAAEPVRAAEPVEAAEPAKKVARKTPRERPAVVDVAAAEKAAAAAAAAESAPASAASATSSADTPDVIYRPSGHAEANSEQELAGHDGQDENDNEMDLFEDGDQSVGAVAAFARSVTAVDEPASAEDVEKAWKDNRLAQVLYHDWEAKTYDEKWSISFDDRCITYARDRFSSLLGAEILASEPWPYGKALEIGAGTGFFSLNLKQAGVLDEVHVSDVSAGMVENAQENARKLGFEVTGTVAGAESLPYEDDTFDIVVGHAVIHHIPDVESALREILRVLKPGGRFVIAGEPTRIGDWYARRLGRVTWELTTRVTALKPFRDRWAKSKEELDESSRAAALEAVVDLHTFKPDELIAMASRAGATHVRTQTEELLAALLGWPVRTFEAAVNPDRLGFGWSMFAYTSWLRLSAADRVLSRAVPQKYFYNVGITGTKGA